MIRLVLVAVLVAGIQATLAEEPVDTTIPLEFRDYPVVEFSVLRLSADQYKYKKVAYEAQFNGAATGFPDYIENSGFSPRRYLLLKVGDAWKLPVLARKTDDLVEQVAALKEGAVVKLYGKVREFRRDPKWKTAPQFYLDLGYLQVVDNRSRKEIQADRKADRQAAQDERKGAKNREF